MVVSMNYRKGLITFFCILIFWIGESGLVIGEDSGQVPTAGSKPTQQIVDELPLSNERFYQIMDKMLEDKLEEVDKIYADLKLTTPLQQFRKGFIEKIKHRFIY